MFDTRFMLNAPYEYARTLEDWSPFVQSDNDSHFIFELRRAHIALLENARWEWDSNFEPGSPVVDSKRPFGNSGSYAITRELHRLVGDSDPDTFADLNLPEEIGDDNEDDARAALYGLWQEVPLALSIMLSCAQSDGTAQASIGSRWTVGKDETWRPYNG